VAFNVLGVAAALVVLGPVARALGRLVPARAPAPVRDAAEAPTPASARV
jgi:hypothetical protein